MAAETTVARESSVNPINAMQGLSSRTRAYANAREARRSGISQREQAVLDRAFDMQRQYGSLSGNQPYVSESRRRNNTRIRRAVSNMLDGRKWFGE